jgi:hypothetical protein
MTTINARLAHLDIDEIRLIALAVFLGENCNDIAQSSYDNCSFEVGGGKYPNEYLVLTDDEASERAREYCKQVFEECYLPEMGKDNFLMNYIDLDKAAEDAVNIDGRGHSLSGYDGSEETVRMPHPDNDEEWLFIYRTN